MKKRIVRIGSPQGIRIPQSLLEEAGLEGDVHLIVAHRSLELRQAPVRAGWAEAFQRTAGSGDDAFLGDVPPEWQA